MSEERQVIPQLSDEIPEDWIKKGESETKVKYRSITFDSFRGKKTEFYIHQPTPMIESFASGAYSRTFGKLLKDPDMMTRKELLVQFGKRGIWGEEQENKVEDIQDQMREIEFAVAETKSRGKGNKKFFDENRKKWLELRNKLTDLITEKTHLLSNSIEGRAEEEEIKTKLSHCVRYPDGSLVWKSVEEFDKEEEKNVVMKLASEAMYFWSGLTQEIIDGLPAQQLFSGEGDQEDK